MSAEFKRNFPCFVFEEISEPLKNAVYNLSFNIAPIIIGHRDLNADLAIILQSTEDALFQNCLHIIQQVIYDGSSYVLSTLLKHSPSGGQYELRTPISANKNDLEEFELAVKYRKIQDYIEILGLPIIDAEFNSLPLESLETAIPVSYSDTKSFLECAHCFYINEKFDFKNNDDKDKFTVSNADDLLLKDEFNKCRRAGTRHPLMIRDDIDAIPFDHQRFPLWQKPDYGRGGIKFYDPERDLILSGAIDDVWQSPQGKLIMVDYKTSSKDFAGTDDDLGITFRRQLSFYAWLFKKNGYPVHDFGYAILNKPRISKYSYEDILFGRYPKNEYVFNPYDKEAKYNRYLEFEPTIKRFDLDYSWIEETLENIANCLRYPEPPKINISRLGKKCFNCNRYLKRKNIEAHYFKIQQKLQAQDKQLHSLG